MKIQIFLALILVVSIAGQGSASVEQYNNTSEQSLGEALTQDEVYEIYGNVSWDYRIPDELKYIGRESASVEQYNNTSEQSLGEALTQDEVNATFGNCTWILPDYWLQESKKNFEKRRLELENKKKANMIKKPLTSSQIAAINANAPEGMFLVHGIDDTSVQKTASEDLQVKNDSLVMEWTDSQNDTTVASVGESTKTSVPNVVVTGATCAWRWVQNESAGNQITIKNYGATAADGFVMIYSYEDSNGWARSYTGLASGEERTLSLPFYVDRNLYTTVGAKSITIRNYVVINSSAYLTSAPTVSSVFVEAYNNNEGYLEDPDDGQNLQLTDLHHHNKYNISVLAALAGDNTSTPYDTGETISNYVNNQMAYDPSALDPILTGSDHWIIENGYGGLCDEFSVLNGDFARALGIPARTIACDLEQNGQPTVSHQFNEIWDGNYWVHSDSTGAYDDPQIYNNDYKVVNNTYLMYHSDDSLSNMDGPDGDGILHGLLDSEFVAAPELELIYN